MIELCEDRCENCTDVNRGIDDTCHEVYRVSDRCPFFINLVMFHEMNNRFAPIELITGWTGCGRFKLDVEYKRHNEEVAFLNKERNDKHENTKN